MLTEEEKIILENYASSMPACCEECGSNNQNLYRCDNCIYVTGLCDECMLLHIHTEHQEDIDMENSRCQ